MLVDLPEVARHAREDPVEVILRIKRRRNCGKTFDGLAMCGDEGLSLAYLLTSKCLDRGMEDGIAAKTIIPLPGSGVSRCYVNVRKSGSTAFFMFQ